MQVTPNPGGMPVSRWRRAARVTVPTVTAAAVAAIGVAAFTDDATNEGNRASAANVAITEDVSASTPLFDVDDWQPGENDTLARCVAITNAGSIALPLTLRLDGAPSGTLGDFIDVTVERGTRDAAVDTADCSTFEPDDASPVVFRGELDELPTAAGAGQADKGAALAVGAERAYRVTWHLQDTEDAEGTSVSGVDFLWETTSAD